MKFDPREAKQLQPGQHLLVPGALGLRLICTPAGRAWTYRWKAPDGRMKQVKLGEWPAMSIGAAMTAWEAARGLRSSGGDPAAERRAARAPKTPAPVAPTDTVGALVEAFADHVARTRKPKGVTELRRLAAAMLGDVAAMPPERVTRAVAYDLISRHAGTPVVARNLRRELGSAWDWAHDSGRLSEEVPNWWRVVLKGRLESKGKIVGGAHQGVQKRVLAPNEVGEVLRMLPHVSRLVGDLIVLYLWTGTRGAEIVAMEGREIGEEPDGWWWTIPKVKTKMARHPLATDLRVPLLGRALELVRARMDVHGQGFLFPPARGRAQHVDQKVAGVGVYWHSAQCTLHPQQVRPRWPMPSWAPHDLRRTVRTRLAALGCPNEVAEAVLGHLQPGVAGVYNRHQYDAERRQWLSRVAADWEVAAGR